MPPVEFLPLAVNPRDYPKALLSMLPQTPRLTWSKKKGEDRRSVFLDCPDWFVQGRYALVEALRRAGVNGDDAVLLPAFHCRTVVESVLFQGAEVRFYPVAETLHPDFTELDRLVADGKVKAMLITHYFGFPNALQESRRFCETHRITLIEDCAHALYGDLDGCALGTVGHYAVASAWKFLPLKNGAMLRHNDNAVSRTPLCSQPIDMEFRSAVGMLSSKLTGRSRLPVVDCEALVSRAQQIAASMSHIEKTESLQFFPNQVNMAGQSVCRWMARHADHAFVIRRRRENYLHWLAGVAGLDGVRPLFDRLPDGTVPYAFPLLTDAAGLVFHALKLAGIPIWRWEDVATTDCPISQGYRLRLLQLPCHQDLRREEIDWMVAVLRGVLPGLLGTAGPGPD